MLWAVLRVGVVFCVAVRRSPFKASFLPRTSPHPSDTDTFHNMSSESHGKVQHFLFADFSSYGIQEPSYSDEDIKFINQIRESAPPTKSRKEHLVLGFRFDLRWALKKSFELYGEVDTSDIFCAEFGNNVRQYRYHCMRESGIARYLRPRVTEVVGTDGIRRYETIIGISENTRARRKLPPLSGVRKLMQLLETEEAPKWYVVSDNLY